MSTGVTTSPDSESLDSWATSNNLGLLYNLKKTASFFSRRWNVGTNPDLSFASFCQDSRRPDRRVLGYNHFLQILGHAVNRVNPVC